MSKTRPLAAKERTSSLKSSYVAEVNFSHIEEADEGTALAAASQQLSFGGVLMASGDLSLERAALVLLSVRMVQVLGMSASALAFLSWSRRLLGTP